MACDPKKIISDLQVTGAITTGTTITASGNISTTGVISSTTSGNAITAPNGSIDVGGGVTAGGAITANANISSDEGNISALNGSIIAGGAQAGGAGTIVVTSDITTTGGNILAEGTITAGGAISLSNGFATMSTSGDISSIRNITAGQNITALATGGTGGIINGITDVQINSRSVYQDTFLNAQHLLTKLALFLGTEKETMTDGGPGGNETYTIYTTKNSQGIEIEYFFFPDGDDKKGVWALNKNPASEEQWNLIG